MLPKEGQKTFAQPFSRIHQQIYRGSEIGLFFAASLGQADNLNAIFFLFFLPHGVRQMPARFGFISGPCAFVNCAGQGMIEFHAACIAFLVYCFSLLLPACLPDRLGRHRGIARGSSDVITESCAAVASGSIFSYRRQRHARHISQEHLKKIDEKVELVEGN